MDQKNNVDKSNKNRYGNGRYKYIRSISTSPSESNNLGSSEPKRSQSQLVFGGNLEQNFYTPFNINPFLNSYHCYSTAQQQNTCWNSHLNRKDNSVSVPSFSGDNRSLQGDQKVYDKRKTKLAPIRKWDREAKINKNGGFNFTLMSYNILAQDLIDNHFYLYTNHNKKALEWEIRWVNILKEIGDADPDILCFQEVQESHIDGYFSILEKKLGYKSIYKKRTGIRTDGCAIYYKTKRLELMEYEKIEYLQKNVSVLNRDNVAIVARFVPKQNPNNGFVVATTHLLYNPKRQDVRLAQVQFLMTEIDKMAFNGFNREGVASYLPIIFTGDLNSTPDSAIYEFITRGVLDYENLSKRSLCKEGVTEVTGKVLIPKSLEMTDNCQYAKIVKERNGEDSIKFSTGTLSHPFMFKSAYNHYFNNEIEGTTYQDKWITVDYVFYSGKRQNNGNIEDKLKVISKYHLLTDKQLKNTKIPNWKLGSDHFSLIVKFLLK